MGCTPARRSRACAAVLGGCARAARRTLRGAARAQVRNAAEEYHAEFAAKEATIAALGADAEAARARMQAEIEKLRTEMEARLACSLAVARCRRCRRSLPRWGQPLALCSHAPCAPHALQTLPWRPARGVWCCGGCAEP